MSQRRGRQGDEIPELAVDFDDDEFVFPTISEDSESEETTLMPRSAFSSTSTSTASTTTTTIAIKSTTTTPLESITSSLSTSTTSGPSLPVNDDDEEGIQTRVGVGGYPNNNDGSSVDDSAGVVSSVGPRKLSLCLPLTRLECGLMGEQGVWSNVLRFIEVIIPTLSN